MYDSEDRKNNFNNLNEMTNKFRSKTDDASNLIIYKLFFIQYNVIDKREKLVRDDRFIKNSSICGDLILSYIIKKNWLLKTLKLTP